MHGAIPIRGVAFAALLSAPSITMGGGECTPMWDQTISATGPVSEVLTVYQHSGGDVYAGGTFNTTGGNAALHIARWDGAQWSPLGLGLNHWAVEIIEFGGDLYAGGTFTIASGVNTAHIARWDGANWFDVAGGVDDSVQAVAVSAIDGAEALYVGGLFANAGGAQAKRIVKWNGAQWSPLGTGITTPGQPSAVFAILEFDLGDGPLLACAGQFTVAGGQFASNIAVWDGSTWSPLGAGLDGAARALAVLDDGNGPALYVGGAFDNAGGVPAKRVAKWDGSSWSAVGGPGSWGFGSSVRALSVFDDGDGARLYAGGEFLIVDGMSIDYVAKWDGGQWSEALGGANGRISSLSAVPGESGDRLLVGGAFTILDSAATASAAALVGCAIGGIPGDLNGDGNVDTADLGLLIANFGSTNPVADINDDGVVDTADLGLLIANFGQ